MDYFELFGLEPAPIIDKASIAKKYFELQKKFHPDFYTQASDAEKEAAMLNSAAINKALTIFKNEDKTLEYFLKWKGIITEDEKYQLSPAFLMEMMELNESLDEQDAAAAKTSIALLEQKMYAPVLPIIQDAALYHAPAQLAILKEWYYKKKYLQRILDRLAD